MDLLRDFTWFDYAFIVVLLISIGYGFVRGFTREILSLITWFLAFWIAKFSVYTVASLLDSWISSPRVRLVAAFVVILVLSLFLLHFIGVKISKFVKSTALTGMDRLLGSVFGFLRGVLICSVAVIVVTTTDLSHSTEWSDTRLRAPFEVVASLLQPKIPDIEWGISGQ